VKTSRFLLFSLVGAGLLGACGDPTQPGVRIPVVEDTLMAFALNGTPRGAPSGLAVVGRISSLDGTAGGVPAVLAVDGSQAFDIAFDVDSAGDAVVYPLRLVVGDLAGPRRVGVREVATSYEALTRAPGGNYPTDSAYVVRPGEVIVIDADNPGYCQSIGGIRTFATNIFAKLTVDRVTTAPRAVYFRVTVDPNCGFRSFAPGRPRN